MASARTPRTRQRLFTLVMTSLLLASAGCGLMSSEPVPEVSNYDLDVSALRSLAASVPGDRPTSVRMTRIGTASLPGAIMMAGKSWDAIEMDHVAFQLVRPDGSFLLIDTGQTREMHDAVPGSEPFDDAAWEEIVRAAESASQILITHEHPDHIGGAAKHPRPDALAGRLQLTTEQLNNTEALDSIDFPPSLRDELTPLEYADRLAVAPGVVVQKAPGHTPGSQLVYVLLADGRELLFVGDVVWNLDAITELRYRPRLMTDWIIGETRETAIHQLRALRDLLDRKSVHIVISHDRRTHAHSAIESGFVFRGAGAVQ